MPFSFRTTDFPIVLGDHFWVLGNYFFNLYTIRGAHGTAVIEAGVSGTVDTVIMQLHLLGLTPDYLIITHPHADHVTGLEGFQTEYPGIRIVAATGAETFLGHPKALNNLVSEDAHMSASLASMGLPPGRPPITEFHFPPNPIRVEQPMEIDLGGVTLHCIPVEGHSPGNLVVHAPEIGALMVSDSLGFHFPGRGILPLFFTGYGRYLKTLNELESLHPTILCPAHQGPILGENVRNAFTLARQAAYRLRSRALSPDSDPDALEEELFQNFYRDEFTMYSPENIRGVARLLVRRAREH